MKSLKKLFTVLLLFLVGGNVFGVYFTSDEKYTTSPVSGLDYTYYGLGTCSYISRITGTSYGTVGVMYFWWGCYCYYGYSASTTYYVSFFHSKEIAEYYLREYSTLGDNEYISEDDFNSYYSIDNLYSYIREKWIPYNSTGESSLESFLSIDSIVRIKTFSSNSYSTMFSYDSRDFDGDGISNYQEIAYCGHPTNYIAGIKDVTTDTDGDGLPDFFEDILGTDSKSTTIFYTISHLYTQYNMNTYTSDKKKINDLLLIYAYVSGCTDVSSVTASELEQGLKNVDSDGDGINNLEEYYLGTNALTKDYYDEEYYTVNELGETVLKDTDQDGLSDLFEDKMGENKNSVETVYDTTYFYDYAPASSSSSSSSSLDDLLGSYETDYSDTITISMDTTIPTKDTSSSSGDSDFSSIESNTDYTNDLLVTQINALDTATNLTNSNLGVINSNLASTNANMITGFSNLTDAINNIDISSTDDDTTTNTLLSAQLSAMEAQTDALESITETTEKSVDLSADKYVSQHDDFSSFLSEKFGFDKLSTAFDDSQSDSLPSWSIDIPISLMTEEYLTFEISLEEMKDYFFVQFFRDLLFYILVFLLSFAYIRILTHY